ncbi:hypothetical protein [Streptomyces sp. NBC_01361]|uniref:hypothetical protein n=1 Tax=Streptomyces sp. NBC_01361 TaxID=2903838 RepID=UPI002E340878|nr:hypothetical protein [Streptomyces sp. NBC_01361]
MTIRQLTVSRGDLGRASGASRMLTYGTTPVGAALGGTVALAVDAWVLFAASTVPTLLIIVPIRRYLSNRAIDEVTRQESAATDTPVSTGGGETPGERCPARERRPIDP